MTKRAYTPKEVETMVLTGSARRCALCFGLNRDFSEKKGQIAHLDKDRNNSSLENLVWLCLECHDRYDSRTSQSKGITKGEVKVYRDKLCAAIEDITENVLRPKIAASGDKEKSQLSADRIAKAEELYSSVQNWSATVSAIFRHLHLLVEDLVTFNDHMDAIISLGNNNPGEFARLSMMLDMHFPELKLDFAKAQIAACRSSQIVDEIRKEWESDYYDGYQYKSDVRKAETRFHNSCQLFLQKIAEMVRNA